MKPIQIQPLSVALGALGAALMLGLVAMRPPQHFQKLSLQSPPHVIVEGIPLPKDMVLIKEGEVYQVPVGSVFVVTGLGRSSSLGNEVVVEFDGVPVWFGSLSTNAQTTHDVPVGLMAQSGVLISSSGTSSVVLGYLSET